MDRRRFLELCGAGAAGLGIGSLLDAWGVAASASTLIATGTTVSVGGAPIRPPAVPLVVRSPYTSAWLCGTELVGAWSTGWNGSTTPICGLVRVDGNPHIWCGDPALPGVPYLTQTSLTVTPTRTIFTLAGAGIQIEAEFLSPIEPGNPQLQSVPLGLLMVAVTSIDGAHHDVELYCDLSGQWVSWDPSDKIKWQTTATDSRNWTMQLDPPRVWELREQMAGWGSAVFSTQRTPAVSYQSGDAGAVRADFVDSGMLYDYSDPGFRAIDDGWPVFALSRNLGTVGSTPDPTYFTLGHFESTEGINYLGETLQPLWQSYWPSWQAMVDEFLGSAAATRQRAMALDERVVAAATAAGGAEYAALCCLAARQAYGACILVRGPEGQPWAFLQELSSGGYISTVDVTFDSCAVWLYLDPGFLAMLLEPILDYAGSARWTEEYAPHSLGLWPIAGGNPGGASSEPMPVQESAGMLIMAAAYAARVDALKGQDFLRPHEDLWSKWSSLLVSQLPVPSPQLTTIDYLGSQTANTNLAALGLVGVGAAAKIAQALGDTAEAQSLQSKAVSLTSRWVRDATDSSVPHLEGAMGQPETWSNLCNAYWDRQLQTDLIPSSVSSLQGAWYERCMNDYGLAVSNAWPALGRVDQQVWTAAWLSGYPVAQDIVAAVAKYVGHTSYTTPFPDTYSTTEGGPNPDRNWRARPVVGGVYALLCLPEG